MKYRQEPPDIPGVSMSCSSPEKKAFIERLRAAGLSVIPATRDYLPAPRIGTWPRYRFFPAEIGFRRISRSPLRAKQRYATVP
ncbi:MAG TPA: hypothetical protein VJT67_11065 [Longimicrobiaceae bacterium]|nr:hypothetical protein [Longimicrobiaceae bacterium]